MNIHKENSMKTDIEIAQEAQMLPITEVVKEIGLTADDLELYGKYKAKNRSMPAFTRTIFSKK